MRVVPTWRGKTDDAAIPARVKLRVFERQNGRCAVHPWEKLRPGHFEYDHALALCLGGTHDELNIRAICTDAHKHKTKADVAIKAKIARQRAKHLGIKPKKPGGFRGHRKFNGEIVWKDR